MPFTMPNFQPLSPEESGSGYGNIFAALQGAMKSPELYKSMVEAKYAPLTTQAKAMSEMAYANLIGPQYIAKLMGNPDILANMSEEQKKQALGLVTSAGMGQSTANGFFNPLAITKAFQKNSSSQPQDISSQNLSLDNQPSLSTQDQSNINNMQPGQAITIQGNQPNQEIQHQETWSEKAGKQAGMKAQGEEAGKLRAQDVKQLSDVVLDATNQQANLDMIRDILKDPELEKIKTFPIQGHKELAWYAATGTPRQKELIGQLRGGLKNQIIQDSTQFKGSFRGGEQDLLSAGLPNENDTLDTMKGKYVALSSMRNMLIQRTQIVSDLEENGMNKNQAIKQADKWVNGDKIRANVEDSIYPPITIRNKKTGEQKTIPYSERNKWTQ